MKEHRTPWEQTREALERWLDTRPTLKWEYERRYHTNPFDAYLWAIGMRRKEAG